MKGFSSRLPKIALDVQIRDLYTEMNTHKTFEVIDLFFTDISELRAKNPGNPVLMTF